MLAPPYVHSFFGEYFLSSCHASGAVLDSGVTIPNQAGICCRWARMPMSNARIGVKHLNLSVLEGKEEGGRPLYRGRRAVNFFHKVVRLDLTEGTLSQDLLEVRE